MKDDQPPPTYDSSAWTGPTPEPDGGGHAFRLLDPSKAHTLIIAFLLAGAILALWVAWGVMLSFHSPSAPVPSTGHTEPLPLFRKNPVVYVKPIEKLVSLLLAIAAFAVPAAYLGWKALLRWLGR